MVSLNLNHRTCDHVFKTTTPSIIFLNFNIAKCSLGKKGIMSMFAFTLHLYKNIITGVFCAKELHMYTFREPCTIIARQPFENALKLLEFK